MGNTSKKHQMGDETGPASVEDLELVLEKTHQNDRLSLTFSRGRDHDEVYRGIYVGEQSFAKNLTALQKAGITHVLNCAEGTSFMHCDTNATFYNTGDTTTSGVIEYMGVRANDAMGYDLSKHFDECCAFIDRALAHSNGKILVHCIQGFSRSPAIVIAYLMKNKGMSARQATRYVKERRVVHPNHGFLKQLSVLDAQLLRQRSAAHTTGEDDTRL